MYTLHIANKNYSSWSLRPWVLMRELDIHFEEIVHPFGEEDFKTFTPSGTVPCLYHGDTRVWDSLAIVEYLFEAHSSVWPTDSAARAWARCAAAEMHSGFFALRDVCSMSCGVRVQLHQAQSPEANAALAKNLNRIDALWCEGLTKFGGSFLAGEKFTAVDAFFSPVVFRLQTYGLRLSNAAQAYVERQLNLLSMQAWYQAALAEPWRDEPHEKWTIEQGIITDDFR